MEIVSKNGTLKEKIEALLEKYNVKPEGLAMLLAELLDDSKSIRYYFLLVKEHSPSLLLQLAHEVKDRAKDGLIRTKKAIYFQGILRRRGMKYKFRDST